MRKNSLFILLMIVTSTGITVAQDQPKLLSHFTRIVASPHVNVILEKGDKESIRLVYSNITPEKVNVAVSGKSLLIYLDQARYIDKNEKRVVNGHVSKQNIYRNCSVTAYVTYKELRRIDMRGEQDLICKDDISNHKIKLKVYGETRVDLSSLHAKKFKVSLYGKNDLKIASGEVGHQVYRSYGENRIATAGLKSSSTQSVVFGEGLVSFSATDEVMITAFGEPQFNVTGSPVFHKGIVIGKVGIHFN